MDVLTSENFDNYTNDYGWQPRLTDYIIKENGDVSEWNDVITYIDLTKEFTTKSRYLNIWFCEDRDGYIYQIYLTNKKE